ncbi:hypothetical protein ACHAW5_005364 [Stephanodiscus triporus]|uniref:Clusterin-associated protein 1 n=1 Tax=Stephanodiscus triporus TaxID=2934178 RepID=A0ABD3PHN8_9STRA
MSDQEVFKQLSEILRRLHYPHTISANSFKSPNFELVAGILCWMVQRLDRTIPIHETVESEDDRVQFLNSIASEIATRTNVCLDKRNLYAGDDRAVKELVKVASILDEALALAEDEASASSEEEIQPEATLAAAERARALVSEITEICARLSSVMENESEDGKERAKALRFLNSVPGISGDSSQRDNNIESSLTRLLESTNATVESLDKQCKILISNQRGMEEKIRKKTIDLERTSKRLESLKNIRPAYMDEYEKLEEEQQVEHERYVVRLRNVDYLEGELTSFKQAVIERRAKVERSTKRMQKKFREEELTVLKGRDDSMRGNGEDDARETEESFETVDDVIRIDEGNRVTATTTNTTPRGNTSMRSEESQSEPSNGGEHSSDESELTGSLIPDDDSDSDSNF